MNKDTIVSMLMTLFVLSVLGIAGPDNKPNLYTTTDDSYGYGYGYGYGSTYTGSSSRTRPQTITKTVNVKFVPANDGFDYDSIYRPSKTEDNRSYRFPEGYNDTWMNKTDKIINKTSEKQEEPEPVSNLKRFMPLGIGLLLGTIVAILARKKKKKVIK